MIALSTLFYVGINTNAIRKGPHPQGGALKPKTREILYCHIEAFFLPLADAPYISVHRTAFLGVVLVKAGEKMGDI
jgi:hypothetical protein